MHDFEGIKKKFFSRPGHPRGQQHLYTSNSFLSLKRFYIKPINNKIRSIVGQKIKKKFFEFFYKKNTWY